jgi:hypothetical protein
MRYVTDWEEICKVVDGEKVERFNNTFEQIKVILALEGTQNIVIEDIFPYFIDYSACYYEKELNQIDDKVCELREVFDEIIFEFHKKTKVLVFLDLIRIDDVSYYSDFDSNERTEFILPMEDMVQLTPKAKKLSEQMSFWDSRK